MIAQALALASYEDGGRPGKSVSGNPNRAALERAPSHNCPRFLTVRSRAMMLPKLDREVADCGRIEGTLNKCGANHVFALDDAEHLPTPSAHPNPRLHIAPRLGIFLLCCLLPSRQAGCFGALAAIPLDVAPVVVANWQLCWTNAAGQVPIAFEKAHK